MEDNVRVVEARKVDLVFQTADGPVHALSEIDLVINKGDFISLIGPSGCGKTTLMRVIADLEKPTGGEIKVNGMTPEEARLQRAYGYVFQAPVLYPWRTVEGNLKLPLEIMGVEKAEQTKRIAEALEMVELTGFGKKFPCLFFRLFLSLFLKVQLLIQYVFLFLTIEYTLLCHIEYLSI